MKRLFFVYFVVAALVAAAFFIAQQSEVHSLRTYQHPEWSEFSEFMSLHSKYYSSELELMQRFGIFCANKAKIEAHNALKLNWTQRMNKFGDLTQAEFQQIYIGNNVAPEQIQESVQEEETGTDVVDWSDITAGIKEQGECWAGWAFSTTGSLEPAFHQKTDLLIWLSEQMLIDCALQHKQKDGCNTPFTMEQAFQYLEKNKLEETVDYEWTEDAERCKADTSKWGTGIKSYVNVKANENALAAALSKRVVSVWVCPVNWAFYYSGVIPIGGCGCTDPMHGATLVGMGMGSNRYYWKVRNSWGTLWGERGFIFLERTKSDTSIGTCGVARMASYPVL